MNISSSNIIKGIIAGFAATVVLTLIMMLKTMMGVMPELDPVHMMADMAAQNMGIAKNVAIGWVMHFGIGSIAWGGAFAVLNEHLPSQSQIIKGITLGIGAWFLMMIGPMPMSGSGLFGLNIGPMVPVMTLIFHIIFGVVLGATYRKLSVPQQA